MNEEAPEVRRSCHDCGWLKAYVSWWCTNPEAKKARGTAIPGVYHCPYWKLDEEYIKEQRERQEHPKKYRFKTWLDRNDIMIIFFVTMIVSALVLLLGIYLECSE